MRETTASDQNTVPQHKPCSHVQKLLFNNFVCEAYGSGNASINGSTVEQTEYEAFVGTAAPTTTIYLEYTPITYVNLPVNLNPFTQFLIRWVTHLLLERCCSASCSHMPSSLRHA